MDSFVAIDFETACWGVACAIGFVHFENGIEIESRYSLIDPGISPQYWDRGAIAVHGIRPDDVVGHPRFGDVWPELIHYAACYPFVAHNANFDMGVLSSELERGGLAAPTIRFGCSMALARNAWPKDGDGSAGPINHKLNTLAEFLEISLHHHNALSDASASGQVAIAATRALRLSSLAAAYSGGGLTWGEITPEPSVAAAANMG